MVSHTSLRALITAMSLAAVLNASAGTLEIDRAHSRIDVDVKATGDSFTAHLTNYEATIALGDDNRITGARLTFHFRDLDTDKDKRDKAMHTWQNTDAFPDGEFTLTSLEPAAGGGFTALGRLTFHGVTRELQFPVSVQRSEAVYAVDGDAPLDTRDFGLPIIRMLGLLKVNPVVHVRFHLQGGATATMGANHARR
ncbi:MAG: YceI family protein [Opitutus sp.]